MIFIQKLVVGLFVLCVASAFTADACSTVIVSAGASASGRPLIWKQRDASNPYNVLKHISPENGYAFTALFNANDSLCRNAYAGVNVAGFAIVNNLSYNIAESEFSPENGYVLRLALERCASVGEFEKFLYSLPLPRKIKSNFGVIDCSGGAAYFEVGDKIVNRFDVPEDGYLFRTNFSLAGDKDSGKGMARYRTEEYLLERHKGKFCPEDLIDGLGRSFYNALIGQDLSRSLNKAVDIDFIPRTTTVSSLCIEIPAKNERLSASTIWTAIGYTPCCYTVPVWLEAEENIPVFVTSSKNDRRAEASILARSYMDKIHHEDRDAKEIYIDFKLLKPIIRAVRQNERREFKEGRALDAKLKESFDLSAVQQYNVTLNKRFNIFKENDFFSLEYYH